MSFLGLCGFGPALDTAGVHFDDVHVAIVASGHQEWHIREIDVSFLETESNVPPVLCVDRGWMSIDCIDAIERNDGVEGGGWKARGPSGGFGIHPSCFLTLASCLFRSLIFLFLIAMIFL